MAKKRDKAGEMSGATVRELRAKLGLTRAQLAGQLGVHPVTLRKWETGLQNVSTAHARLLRLMVTMQQ